MPKVFDLSKPEEIESAEKYKTQLENEGKEIVVSIVGIGKILIDSK